MTEETASPDWLDTSLMFGFKDFGAIAGRGLTEATPITGDHADAVLAWKDGGDLAALEGEFVRVRFVMRDARIFSMRAE